MRLFEERFDVVVLEGDGPTECSPATAVNPPEGPRKPGTIGPAIPGVFRRQVTIRYKQEFYAPIGTPTTGVV